MEISKSNPLEKTPSSFQIADNNESTKVRGGWITVPFIIGSIMGLTLAAGSWYTNLTMYLTREYNIKNNVATRIFNIMNIGVCFFSILGALLSDSFLGSSLVINVSSFASLTGLIMLSLSTIIPSLRPHPCNLDPFKINANCIQTPTTYQYAFLIVALSLATIGFGCTRFLLSSVGAYQFDKAKHRRIFFNVYILAYEVCWAANYGVIGYVLKIKNRWKFSFAIGMAGNSFAILLFRVGSQFFRHILPCANPLFNKFWFLIIDMMTTLRASKAKNRIYDDQHPNVNVVHQNSISTYFRSSSQVSSIDDYGANHDNMMIMMMHPKTLSQNPKEAQDLENIKKILPIWSTNIILNIAVPTSLTLVKLQASTMNLTFGTHVKLREGFTDVVNMIFTAITLSIFDILLLPLWQKVFGRPMKPLQRGGTGHVLVVVGLIGLAIVDMARLDSIKSRATEPMSATWLIFPLAILGIGAGYYFPGAFIFHFQEFPDSLKSTSTCLPSIQSGIGFYLSKVFIDVVNHETSWLQINDINHGRLDLIYWILALIVAMNFGYYLVCTIRYKYINFVDSNAKPIVSSEIDQV